MTSFVLALDLATISGWAKGYVGGEPNYGSLRFAKADASENAIFNAALRWANELLAEKPRPDFIMIERLLPGDAKRGHTNSQVRDRLAGLHAIVRAMAFERGVYRIETVDVGAARRHFIGDSPAREQAKREVMRQCRKLGWAPADDNAGDALALWHYQCSRIDPRLALRVSPLFASGIAL
jgi:hypothetical protein